MAYAASGLTLVGYGGGYHVYHYQTSDILTTVLASGYFDNANTARNLTVGDVIHVFAGDGYQNLRIDAITAGVVTTEMGAGETQWVTAELTDVSTASSTWVAAPFDGIIRRFKTVLHGAIATADADVGLEIGGTDVTGGQVTITQSGSAAGDVDETTCTALNAVTEGQAVEVDTDGASTNTISVTCMIEFVPN